MQISKPSRMLSRREFLKLGGGLLAGAATSLFAPELNGLSSEPGTAHGSLQIPNPTPDIHLAVGGGYIHLPRQWQITAKWNDLPIYAHDSQPFVFAPDNQEVSQETYIFGFRDVTGMPEKMVTRQKMKVQTSAPLVWVDQEQDYLLAFSNLGQQFLPDGVDSHTIYWSGFSNAFSISGNEPRLPVAVPVGHTQNLHYQPRIPGTHIYRCSFEAVEHRHLGLSGTVFVRPIQNGDTTLYPSGLFAYNDQDGSTGYDREFAITLSDIWKKPSKRDADRWLLTDSNDTPEHILLNGRVYPDTLVGNGGEENGSIWGHDSSTGDLLSPPNRPDLRYQPISSLIEAESGERILIRFANLSCQQRTLMTVGLSMKVTGRNAMLLRGSKGTDLSYKTDKLHIGVGESFDVIITAPAVKNETRFLLYPRNAKYHQNDGGTGYGSPMTEIRIHPAGTLGLQILPNTNPRL